MRLKVSMMLALALLVSTFAFASSPIADSKVKGILTDAACGTKAGTAEKAKGHPKACSLKEGCAKSGFAVVTADGKVLKLDDAGNAKAKAVLEASKKDSGVEVEVVGSLEGDKLAVKSITEQ